MSSINSYRCPLHVLVLTMCPLYSPSSPCSVIVIVIVIVVLFLFLFTDKMSPILAILWC